MISAHTCDLLYSSTSSSQVHLGYFNTPQANLGPHVERFLISGEAENLQESKEFWGFCNWWKNRAMLLHQLFQPPSIKVGVSCQIFSLYLSVFFLSLPIQELLVEHWYSRWWWRHSSRQVMAPAPENQRKCPWQETFSSFNSFPWKSDVRDLNSVELLLLLPSRTAIKTKVSKLNDISGYSDWICKQSTKKEKRTNRRCIRRFFLF